MGAVGVTWEDVPDRGKMEWFNLMWKPLSGIRQAQNERRTFSTGPQNTCAGSTENVCYIPKLKHLEGFNKQSWNIQECLATLG